MTIVNRPAESNSTNMHSKGPSAPQSTDFAPNSPLMTSTSNQPIDTHHHHISESTPAMYGGLATAESLGKSSITESSPSTSHPVMNRLQMPSNPPSTARVEMTNFIDEDNDDSDGEGSQREKRAGRRKILIQYIDDKSRRHITFSKRKAGIMKKAYELSTLTGTQVLLLVASETGHVYTFATPKLQPLITKPEGKNLIQACLNAPDTTTDYPQPSNHSAYEDETGKDGVYDDRHASAANQANMQAANYAAAMAGLAGFQYPGGAPQMPSQAYMNPVHYPAYAAAQYNAAMAAGYWPSHSGNVGGMSSGATMDNRPPQSSNQYGSGGDKPSSGQSTK